VIRALVLALAVAACQPNDSFYATFAFDYSHPIALVHTFGGFLAPDALVVDRGGGLVGVMFDSSCGTVFAIAPDGTMTTRYALLASDGCGPQSLVEGADGTLYVGTLGGTVFRLSTGNVVTQLRTGQNDHVYGLVLAPDGTLFGAASGGIGINNVFRISPSGAVTNLYAFGDDIPFELTVWPNGDLYGVAISGSGAHHGTVFALSPDGTLRTVHAFDGTDGANPSWLVATAAGELWGTTLGGGAHGYGTVFRLAADETFQLMHSFEVIDGDSPDALIEGGDGSLYGVAQLGGDFGLGTLYRLEPDGSGTVLHSFAESEFGNQPRLLVRGITPALFGTTIGPGVLFRFDL